MDRHTLDQYEIDLRSPEDDDEGDRWPDDLYAEDALEDVDDSWADL